MTKSLLLEEVNKVSSENLDGIIKTLRVAVKKKKRITDTHKALFLFRARHLKEEIIRGEKNDNKNFIHRIKK